jgi:glutamine synthetase
MEAADRAQLFKTTVKQVGYRHGILPSFMAKPHASLPGCGGHLHISLWKLDGLSNVFYDKDDPHHMSLLMKQFLAGVLHALPEILPMYLPNINRYLDQKFIIHYFFFP